MNIVAIDTSGPLASCALMTDGQIRYAIQMNRGLTHSETIMPAVDELLGACELSCAQIDCFAAVAGPGSFTGVRIGVCAAKGLAHAWNRACARIDALEALAMNFCGFDGLVCPLLDARRGQVYCAAFDTASGMPERIMQDEALAIDDFVSALPAGRRLMFLGDGIRVHEQSIRSLRPEAMIAPPHLREIHASAACVLASARTDAWMSPHSLTPIYLRLPQAERERNAREAMI